MARYRTPPSVAARLAADDPMNRLVSSMVAAACSIIAATADGGSAPGSLGLGIRATSGMALRSAIP